MDEYTFKEIIERNHTEVKAELQEIKEQTIKTNGRVTSLEKWKWLLTGAFIMLSGLVLNLQTIKEFLIKVIK